MVRHASGRKAAPMPAAIAEAEVKRWTDLQDRVARMDGPENPYKLWWEMGEMMTDNVTVVRDNRALAATDAKLREMMDRWWKIGVPDKGAHANQAVVFTRQLWNMLELARVITVGAMLRNESRGAHYKPEFPERDDENFLKTTRAMWSPDGPVITYEPVDTSLIPPRRRVYSDAEGSKSTKEDKNAAQRQTAGTPAGQP
jgi:succinate dehydrogenase / fumarate reductase flavoprotein subunit